MTISPGRALLLGTVSEEQLLQFVLSLAKRNGWRTYHTRDSRRSAAGFPDVIAVRGDRLLAIEVKSMKGVVRPEQHVWRDALNEVPGIDAYVFRPCDEAEIERVLA